MADSSGTKMFCTVGALAALGTAAYAACKLADSFDNHEHFSEISGPTEHFGAGSVGTGRVGAVEGLAMGQTTGAVPNNPGVPEGYAVGGTPLNQQLNQLNVAAATPSVGQLQAAAGLGVNQATGQATSNSGMLSSLSGNNVYSEVQGFNNNLGAGVSACALNAPSFVSSALLPKSNTTNKTESFQLPDPAKNYLLNQNFLSASQMLGSATVLSSLRNSSHDIRNNIPNPMKVVSPWINSTITPDLERRPLDCYVPESGLYGCSPQGCNTNNVVGPTNGQLQTQEVAGMQNPVSIGSNYP